MFLLAITQIVYSGTLSWHPSVFQYMVISVNTPLLYQIVYKQSWSMYSALTAEG